MLKKTLSYGVFYVSGVISCLADGVEYIADTVNDIFRGMEYGFIADLKTFVLRVTFTSYKRVK